MWICSTPSTQHTTVRMCAVFPLTQGPRVSASRPSSRTWLTDRYKSKETSFVFYSPWPKVMMICRWRKPCSKFSWSVLLPILNPTLSDDHTSGSSCCWLKRRKNAENGGQNSRRTNSSRCSSMLPLSWAKFRSLWFLAMHSCPFLVHQCQWEWNVEFLRTTSLTWHYRKSAVFLSPGHWYIEKLN